MKFNLTEDAKRILKLLLKNPEGLTKQEIDRAVELSKNIKIDYKYFYT